jgi:hypothetical protein
MLSPDVITVSADLANAYSEIVNVNRFTFASMNILVGKLSPDPDWLAPVRQRIGMLSETSAEWQKQEPEIWVGTLQPFVDYSTLFQGVSETSKKFGNDPQTWINALQGLQAGLDQALAKTTLASNAFTSQIQHLGNVESLLNESLDTAWQELANEEQEMVKLASEITHLQDQLDQLQSSITSAEISSGQSYIKTAVTISYTLVKTAGAEIPYLSILSELYTIGKMAYDLIVTDKQIAETIDKIVKLRVKASEEAQAAAMTKAVIQLINRLDKSIAAMVTRLGPFSTMWSSERSKIDAVIEAINAGAEPRYMTELVSMPSALASWQQLAQTAQTILTEYPEQGTPVTITTSSSDPISSNEQSIPSQERLSRAL